MNVCYYVTLATEVSQENNLRDGLSRVSVLEDGLVWMRFDGHSTSRCYLCAPWGQLPFFASLDLFTTETRQLRSVTFVAGHA